MAYLVINSVTFSGLPNGTGNQSAWQPTGYDETPTKIGVTLVAANGTRNRVERGVTKRAWKLTWEGCNYATMQTIRTISLLTSTFAFSDVGGTAYTVQTVTNSRANVTLSDFGSLRARFGWVAGCFMPYGFLGAGFGNRTIDRFVAASPASISPTWSADSKEKLVYGYSAGFGVDTMIVGGLFVRAEYEYQRVTADYESYIHSARLGLGYKF